MMPQQMLSRTKADFNNPQAVKRHALTKHKKGGTISR